MAPVSLTWGLMDDEAVALAQLPCGAPGRAAAEAQGPYALCDVLAEIIERYAPRTTREDRRPRAWLVVPAQSASMSAAAL